MTRSKMSNSLLLHLVLLLLAMCVHWHMWAHVCPLVCSCWWKEDPMEKISLEPAPSSTSPEPTPSSSPHWSLRVIIESALEPLRHRQTLLKASTLSFPTMVKPLYALPSSLTRVGDAVNHIGAIPKPAMPFPSPQHCHPPWARDVLHPAPFPSPRRRWPTPSSSP
jgi:hypothetical protein